MLRLVWMCKKHHGPVDKRHQPGRQSQVSPVRRQHAAQDGVFEELIEHLLCGLEQAGKGTWIGIARWCGVLEKEQTDHFHEKGGKEFEE